MLESSSSSIFCACKQKDLATVCLSPNSSEPWLLANAKSTLIWALVRENLSLGVCEQQSPRPAQSGQRLCYLLIGKNSISIFYLVSLAEETGLSLVLSETLTTGFLAHYVLAHIKLYLEFANMRWCFKY